MRKRLSTTKADPPSIRDQSGISLMEVLLVGGVMTVFLLGFSQVTMNTLKQLNGALVKSAAFEARQATLADFVDVATCQARIGSGIAADDFIPAVLPNVALINSNQVDSASTVINLQPTFQILAIGTNGVGEVIGKTTTTRCATMSDNRSIPPQACSSSVAYTRSDITNPRRFVACLTQDQATVAINEPGATIFGTPSVLTTYAAPAPSLGLLSGSP